MHSLYETLNGYVHIGHLSEQNAFFHGSIPPGGELVVDSDNYIVLLNGENAIAQYSGDWIFVSRPTVNLTLSIPGSRGYSWEVFYIERYL